MFLVVFKASCFGQRKIASRNGCVLPISLAPYCSLFPVVAVWLCSGITISVGDEGLWVLAHKALNLALQLTKFFLDILMTSSVFKRFFVSGNRAWYNHWAVILVAQNRESRILEGSKGHTLKGHREKHPENTLKAAWKYPDIHDFQCFFPTPFFGMPLHLRFQNRKPGIANIFAVSSTRVTRIAIKQKLNTESLVRIATYLLQGDARPRVWQHTAQSMCFRIARFSTVATQIQVKLVPPKYFVVLAFVLILAGTDDLSHSCLHWYFTPNFTFAFTFVILKVTD